MIVEALVDFIKIAIKLRQIILNILHVSIQLGIGGIGVFDRWRWC